MRKFTTSLTELSAFLYRMQAQSGVLYLQAEVRYAVCIVLGPDLHRRSDVGPHGAHHHQLLGARAFVLVDNQICSLFYARGSRQASASELMHLCADIFEQRCFEGSNSAR